MADSDSGPDRNAHLIERAAAQMRAAAGLSMSGPPPGVMPPILPATGAAATLEAPRPRLAADLAADQGDTLLAELPERSAPGGDAPMGRGGEHDAPAEPDASPCAPGVVLDISGLKRAGLALAGSRSRVTEEYRITVGRILRALRSGTRTATGVANVVMVTSARPGEGKSFSSLNLAASIAQNGLSDVLLVDVDGKPRSITTLLGLRDRPGLLDLVDNPAARPEEMVVRTAVDGLTVLPLGLNRATGADGGVTRAVIAALERVRRRFSHHVLLLDTAPCLSTSDPSTLAPLVDQVIMVVEAGRTQRAELGAALDLVRACPNVLLVLNKVRLTHRHSFGSYYYFGYPS